MTAVSLPPFAAWAPAFRVRPYLGFARLGARQEVAMAPALLARVAFLAVLLFIFSRLWETVLAEASLDIASAGGDVLWYVAITEWVILSFPQVHLDVQADLRSGEIVARLPQPVSYPAARIAEAAGVAAVRATALGVATAGIAFVLAGGPPSEPAGLATAVPLALLGIVLALLSVAAIGVCALWLHDAAPLFWVWQKLAFVLGGLVLPLSVYPGPLEAFARWTPFGAMLNGPARQVLSLDPGDAALVGAQLFVWNAAAIALVMLLWHRAGANLEGYGG